MPASSDPTILHLAAEVGLADEGSDTNLGPFSAALRRSGDGTSTLQIRSQRSGHIVARGALTSDKICPVSQDTVLIKLTSVEGAELTFSIRCNQSSQAALELQAIMLQRQDSAGKKRKLDEIGVPS